MLLALDRSARYYDADGRLHVRVTNISKANICGYYGREIPGYDELGLTADRIYNLYRDPVELAKAAPTFDNLQLLEIHTPVSADDPKREVVVGSTGTDGAFADPYLQNSIVVWDGEAIGRIERGEVKELSCGYRYTPDMTPGRFEFGAYDGVMRDIVGNHVALVTEGRAGPDVVVADAKPEMKPMFKTRKSPKLQAIVAALDGKLADGADISAVELALDEAEAEEAEDADPEAAEDEDPEAAEDADPEEGKAMDAATVAKMINAAIAQDRKARTNDKAMDEAVKALDAKMKAVDTAKTAVRPHVGEVTGAYDSAADIYRLALDAKGVSHKGVTDVAGLALAVSLLKSNEAVNAFAVDSAPISGDAFAEFKK